MATVKEKSLEYSEKNDPILAEVRRAREQLQKELEANPEEVHQRALRHIKEFGFTMAKRKPAKPKK